MEEMVSIIVPVYMAEAYIAETIEMVRRQTYKTWELILVDDASPDDSAEIIQGIINKVKERIYLINLHRNFENRYSYINLPTSYQSFYYFI